MNTLHKLAEINNDADFELIATHVLRLAKPEYASVIHTGISQNGKPVASPVDGFGKVPHSQPPHYVQFQHTITSCNGLQKKWLHDHRLVQVRITGEERKSKLPSESDDGDILKAGRQISKIQQTYPNARFTIVLTTNCTIHKLDFLDQIYDKVDSFGQNIAVDIWTCDRLAGFLDTTQEGHWIRKEYLKIEAEMLSHSLLTEICQRSLSEYKKYCRFLTPPQKWIYRDLKLENSRANPKTLHFVVGESGFGKSAYAYQQFEQYLEHGNYALWLPAHLIEKHFTINGVIEDVLQELYPSLERGASRQIPQLLQDNNPLLLVIDDINNHTKKPQNVINHLISWLEIDTTSTQHHKNKPPLPFIAICPAWPQIIRTVQSNRNWVTRSSISTFAVEQATLAIQEMNTKGISQLTARELAIQLNGDPFLIGVLCSAQADVELSSITPMIASRQIVNTFIEQHFLQSDYGGFTLEDYKGTLRAVANFMLMTRNHQPKWSHLREYFGINSLQWEILDRIARYEIICSKEPKLDQFRFRHDRIFESIAVDCFIYKLSETPYEEIIWEPYYAEMVGAALAQIQCKDELLEDFLKKMPLVLASAFRTFGEPTSSIHQQIIDILKYWASWPLRFDRQESLEIVSTLSQVDSPILNDRVVPD